MMIRSLRKRTQLTLFWCCLLLPLGLSCPCSAMYMGADADVPIERLIENAKEHIKAHPDDEKGHYILGRVHILAFELDTESLKVVSPGALGDTSGLYGHNPQTSEGPRRDLTQSPLPGRVREHLRESIRYYTKADELAGSPGHRTLALATSWEKGVICAGDMGLPPDLVGAATQEVAVRDRKAILEIFDELLEADEQEKPDIYRRLRPQYEKAVPLLVRTVDRTGEKADTALRGVLVDYWRTRALSIHLSLFNNRMGVRRPEPSFLRQQIAKRWPKNRLKIRARHPLRDDLLVEASASIARILENRGPTGAERREISRLRGLIAEENARRRWITPVIISLEPSLNYADLIDEDARVVFDLDGDNIPSLWPWVTDKAGILVWDPKGEGRIESGLRLFGNTTWWFFWDNGYQPLQFLDDDLDGWLSGSELEGICVWRDADGNAVSDQREVKPVAEHGIERIAVKPTGSWRGMPSNAEGIVLKDGSFLPSLDWIPARIGDAPDAFDQANR